MANSLQPHELYVYSPWNSPDQNTGVGSLSLLQGSSQHRDQTQVSHIAGEFLTSWVTEYIMWNAGLQEAQAINKIARRNISNLRYADDTTLWQKAKKN